MVQVQILNKVLASQSLDFILDNGLGAEQFAPYTDEYNFIMEHHQKYGNVPDVATFLDHFEEFELIDVQESDRYLLDKIHEEFQYTNAVPILKKASELLKSDANAAVDYLMVALQQLPKFADKCGVSIIKQAQDRYDEYMQKRNATTPWMLETGFRELDEVTGGLNPGEELCVLFARTNNGKSWVLAKVLEHNWRIGKNVGMISPEMGANRIGYRFDALNAHFSNFALYAGREAEGYEEYIHKLMTDETIKNDFIVAEPSDPFFNNHITISRLRKFVIDNKLDVLGIDGIEYLEDERYCRGDSEATRLKHLSQDLMKLSCELKIPIIIVAQANRNGVTDDGTLPALDTISSSDGIAHNASTVVSLKQTNNKLKMELVKARNCKVGIKLTYDWDIDKGIFTYNDSPESDSEEVTSRYQRENRDAENRQPIRRQSAADVPLPF